jgi:ribosome maturation factor RimP
LLDVENPISGNYNLEVSSPGLSRSFFKADQYERYIGRTVCLYLQQPQNGKRKFVGEIKAVIDGSLELIINGETIAFDLININKANLSI